MSTATTSPTRPSCGTPHSARRWPGTARFTTTPLSRIQKAIDAGRFDIPDAELALAIGTGALLGLLQTIESRPAADRFALTDETAMRMLLALGLRRADAKRLVSRPLPELPADMSPYPRLAGISTALSSLTSS